MFGKETVYYENIFEGDIVKYEEMLVQGKKLYNLDKNNIESYKAYYRVFNVDFDPIDMLKNI